MLLCANFVIRYSSNLLFDHSKWFHTLISNPQAFGTKHHLNWHRKSKSCGQRQADCQKQRPPTVALIQNRNTLQTPEQRQQEGRYKCTECDKSYANAQTIYLHMQKHQAMREGRFKCEVCKLVRLDIFSV